MIDFFRQSNDKQIGHSFRFNVNNAAQTGLDYNCQLQKNGILLLILVFGFEIFV